tara:strand:- start:959 stop:1438 length:480 start_codon:yes stop_codon:yes gene_type:complete
MAKYITILFILLIGCKINSEQLIKTEHVDFDIIKFNAVSKDLKFTNNQNSSDVEIAKKLINDWFNNNIKVDGFDGNLSVNVTSIDINKIKKNEYYRFEVDMNIEFSETNETLNKRKIYKINSIEYADIEGNFSIKDTENLNRNTISQSLKSINKKILGM